MENSFYYFFSATPQVLGAIMGLFGVLIIFKIQSLKEELLSHAVAVLDLLNLNFKKRLSEVKTNKEIMEEIEKAISTRSLPSISSALSLIDPKTGVGTSLHMTLFDRDIERHRFLITHVKSATLITSIVILLSLIIIPFGDWLLKHDVFVHYLYFIIILGIIITLIYYLIIFDECLLSSEIRFTHNVSNNKRLPSKYHFAYFIDLRKVIFNSWPLNRTKSQPPS